MIAYVLGYGSLPHPQDWAMQDLPGRALPGFLKNHRRSWKVGIDNMASSYDHKHYRSPSGERSKKVISTLGIYASRGDMLSGVAIPVDEVRLMAIDAREQSYRRSEDLSDYWEGPGLQAPLYTYYPKEENIQLYDEARKTGGVVLPRHYLQYCQEAFLYWKHDFWIGTDRVDCPLEDLEFWSVAR